MKPGKCNENAFTIIGDDGATRPFLHLNCTTYTITKSIIETINHVM